jgi:replicative DNA helicase
VEGHRLRNGRMIEDEWRRIDNVQRQIMALPMHIIDTPAMTSGEIKAQSRRLRAIHGTPALVVIDYLQIAEPAERQKEERLRVTQMVRDFKNLARHLEAPVLCLSQLSRGVNQRENKRPMLSDLRETSAIEAESDVVLFVYRPAYYQPKHRDNSGWVNDEAPEPDEVIVGKQRNGPTGVVPVKFVAEFARFESLETG